MKVLSNKDIEQGDTLKAMVADGSVVTIGNFDGVHVGHHAILSLVKQRARELVVPSIVVTFHPHPRKVLSSPEHLRLLLDKKEKCALLEKIGIDALVTLNFDKSFASQTPVEFIERWLMKFNPKAVVVGYDFSFGRGGAGTLEILKEEGKIRGFVVEVVEASRVDGMVVSSSRIRNLIEAGEIAKANRMLGRPYSLHGSVVKGHGRGRKIGFPTANIDSSAEVVPADGVYAGEVVLAGNALPAMVNIGTNPTFEDMVRTIEACILDFDGDIYGREAEVRFLERIRPEIKFNSVEELVKQIEKDQEVIEEFFRERQENQKC
mgnify:CR=1 FL=1